MTPKFLFGWSSDWPRAGTQIFVDINGIKEKKERMARERKKLSIVQSSEVNGLLAFHFLQDRPVKSFEWHDPS